MNRFRGWFISLSEEKRCTLATLVFIATYIVLELKFNARLLDLFSSPIPSGGFSRMEDEGKLLAGIGIGLFLAEMATGWLRIPIIKKLLVFACTVLLIAVAVYEGLTTFFDRILDGLSPDSKAAGLQIAIMRNIEIRKAHKGFHAGLEAVDAPSVLLSVKGVEDMERMEASRNRRLVDSYLTGYDPRTLYAKYASLEDRIRKYSSEAPKLCRIARMSRKDILRNMEERALPEMDAKMESETGWRYSWTDAEAMAWFKSHDSPYALMIDMKNWKDAKSTAKARLDSSLADKVDASIVRIRKDIPRSVFCATDVRSALSKHYDRDLFSGIPELGVNPIRLSEIPSDLPEQAFIAWLASEKARMISEITADRANILRYRPAMVRKADASVFIPPASMTLSGISSLLNTLNILALGLYVLSPAWRRWPFLLVSVALATGILVCANKPEPWCLKAMYTKIWCAEKAIEPVVYGFGKLL